MRGERNDFLLLFKVAVGLLGVVDGRNEVRPVVASSQQSAIGSEIGHTALMLHYQHAKHLSAVSILPDVRMTGDIRLHLLSRHFT